MACRLNPQVFRFPPGVNRSRFSTRIEKALSRPAKRMGEGRLKDRNKIERQIGKIQARHPQVADMYQMEVVEASEGLRLA